MGERGLRAGGWPAYRTLWIFLLLGWTVSAADRALTGPVVTWMIDNNVAFLADTDKPYALGGLIGGLFFAGYMLTQFPGGYLGDKYGHRTIIVISLFWAGIATMSAASSPASSRSSRSASSPASARARSTPTTAAWSPSRRRSRSARSAWAW
jgi:MFS family permease